jgi:hypothetical protein
MPYSLSYPQVRHYVNTELAARLRPELEQLVKENDSTPGGWVQVQGHVWLACVSGAACTGLCAMGCPAHCLLTQLPCHTHRARLRP